MDATLSGPHDTIPDNKGYKYDKIIRGGSGDTTLLTKDNRSKVMYTQPFMAEVIELEEAKHHASNSTSDMVLADTQDKIERCAKQVQKSQRAVSLKRIALLRSLTNPGGATLCTDISPSYVADKSVSVSYNLYDSNGDILLNPIQSQYAWILADDGTEAWSSLIYKDPGTFHQSDTWHQLLKETLRVCPRKEWAARLLDVTGHILDDDAPPLDFNRNGAYNPSLGADMWHKPESNLTALEEFNAESINPTGDNIRYKGLVGAFLMNKFDQKQSARINTVIQKTILKATNDHINLVRERRYEPTHLNTAAVAIKIQSRNHTHVLTITPFAGHEACTVSHIHVVQDIRKNTDSEVGIVQIPEILSDIKPLPVTAGSTTCEKAYICLGAYRNTRLNEPELNSIHLNGIHPTSSTDPLEIPAPSSIDYDTPLPFAKAVRTSCQKWDILATSIKHKNSMHTVITLVNYPPFGTQVWMNGRIEDKEPATPYVPNPGQPRHTGSVRDATPRTRAPREDKWLMDSDKNFFVRGITGSPFDERFYVELIAVNDATKRRQMRERAVAIRNKISAAYSTVWDSAITFYQNLEQNDRVPEGQDGPMREVWSREWRTTIRNDIESWDVRGEQIFNIPGGKVYWWTYDTTGRVWEAIIPDVTLRSKWVLFLNTIEVEANIQPKILPALAGRSKHDTMIKLPRRQAPTTVSKPTPEITQMQARLRALEAKLDQSRQEANNTHLLQEVLAKLDQPSALRY